jgi:alpha-beta hydrolase superfamily lysophospholipase
VPETEAGGRAFKFLMRIRRAFRAIGIVVVAGAFLLAASAWFMGSLLIKPQNHTVTAPAGFSAERVSIPGVGHAVSGWWVDAGNGTPVVLLVHGLGADRSSMVPRAELLKARGFSSLLIDLQGEGETKGEAITMGYRESKDVTAARDWIRLKTPGRKIGVIGTSLGGAAVLLALQPSGFDAVVLEAVYPRLGRAVENRIRMKLGFLAPVLTPLLLMQLEPRLHISVSELEPIRRIGKLGAPVLVAAGSNDLHTTLEESQELFDAAAQPKSLWIVEGAKHQDMLAFDPKGYEEHVVGFLSAALTPGSPVQYEPRDVGVK